MKLEEIAAKQLSSCEVNEFDTSSLEEYNWNMALSIRGTTGVKELATAWSHQKRHFKSSWDGTCAHCGEYTKVSMLALIMNALRL